MANTLKSVSSQHISGASWSVPYTVPVGKTAIGISAIATNDYLLQTSPVAMSMSVVSGGVRTVLANQVAVTNSGAVNMMAAKVALNAGDTVEFKLPDGTNISRFNRQTYTVAAEGFSLSTSFCMTNGDTVIAVGNYTTGIMRSADAGQTWTRVQTGWHADVAAKGSANWVGEYINGAFFIYTSTTWALRSTDDGVTWAWVAVTNAPGDTTAGRYINYKGNVVRAGATYASLNSAGTAMLTTTDGITWTSQTAFPAAVYGLCWTGTNFLACRAATQGDIYYSTNGAAWSTVAFSASAWTNPSQFYWGPIVSNGAGLALVYHHGTGGWWKSTDHGLTWAVGGLSSGMGLVWTGQCFMGFSTSNQCFLTTDGVSVSASVGAGESGWSNRYIAVTTTKLLNVGYSPGGSQGYLWATTSFNPAKAYSGMSVTLSVMEVA